MENTREARRERFEAVFQENVRRVLAYALRRVAEPADAADVVAETFLVAWRRLDDLPAGDEARPWLFGVARRVLANQRRGQLRRSRLAAALGAQVSRALVVDESCHSEDAQMVASALARLDDRDREVLQLTVWEGLTPSQLATAMSIPAATVRTRLHRARRRLRGEMEELQRRGERVELGGHDSTDEEEPVQDRGERA
ncbi:MAG: RNA polymerase sigma factor [Acidimicrobiia bacterium]